MKSLNAILVGAALVAAISGCAGKELESSLRSRGTYWRCSGRAGSVMFESKDIRQSFFNDTFKANDYEHDGKEIKVRPITRNNTFYYIIDGEEYTCMPHY